MSNVEIMANLFAFSTANGVNEFLKTLSDKNFRYHHFWLNQEKFRSGLEDYKPPRKLVCISLQTNSDVVNDLNNNDSSRIPYVIYGELKPRFDRRLNIDLRNEIDLIIEENICDDNALREKIYDFLLKFIVIANVRGKIKVISDHLGFYSLHKCVIGALEVYSNWKKSIWRLGASTSSKLDRIPRESSIPVSKIVTPREEQSAIRLLKDLLSESILKGMPEKSRIGVMFSGGLDSLVLTKLILEVNEKLHNEVILLSSGLRNSTDLRNVRLANNYLKLPLEVSYLDISGCLKELPEILRTVERYDTLNVSLALAEYFSLKRAAELELKIIFTGQGADEIFYGYHKYIEAFKKSENIKKISDGDLSSLSHRNLERETKLALKFDLELKYPYLDTKVISYARNLPDEYKIKFSNGDVIGKYALRRLCILLGIPESLISKKIAMQYGSGSMKILKKISSREKPQCDSNFKITTFLKKFFSSIRFTDS